jgi:hypothetical protein
MCVIDNEKYVLVNTNDCPYPIAYEALTRIVQQYPQIDFSYVYKLNFVERIKVKFAR